MENVIFRRATDEEIPRIIQMQSDVFSGEQGIPSDDIDTFMEKEPTCWCAEKDGKIYAAVAAWKEGKDVHWGRFVTFPAARGQHLGTELARCSFDDLFSGDVEEIYMDKIVCQMGGKIIGKPYEFYKGNVTPVLLTKSDYRK